MTEFQKLVTTSIFYLSCLSALFYFFGAILLPSTKVSAMDLEGKILNFAKKRNVQITFGTSSNWQYLREMVFKIQGTKCLCCGKEVKGMHVDHIMPKSSHPQLEFMIDNLQVLCPDCNRAKSNVAQTDFRKSDHIIALLREIDDNKLLKKKYVYDYESLVRLAHQRFKDELGGNKRFSLLRTA